LRTNGTQNSLTCLSPAVNGWASLYRAYGTYTAHFGATLARGGPERDTQVYVCARLEIPD